jgi:hypothetical protein
MKTNQLLSLTLSGLIMFMSFSLKAGNSGVKVYPTPSHEKLVIKSDENGYLRIVDQNGILVKETPIYKGENELKLSEMTAQKYILQVKTGGESVVKHLFVR